VGVARLIAGSATRRLSLRVQLLISFMLVALLAAAVGVLSVLRINDLDDHVDYIRQNNLTSLTALNEARAAQARVFQNLWVHSAAQGSGNSALREIMSGTDTAMQHAFYEFGEHASVDGRAGAVDLLDQWLRFRLMRDAYFFGDTVPGNVKVPATPAGFEEIAAEVGSTIEHMAAVELADAETRVAAAHSSSAQARIVLISAVAVALLAAFAFALLISRRVVASLRSVGRVLDSVAAGDLTQTAPTAHGREVRELATAVNTAATSLRQTVGALASSAALLSSTSVQLTSASDDVSAGAEEVSGQSARAADTAREVSANVLTVAAASEEMSVSIREIAASAIEGANVATRAVEVARTTGATVSRLTDSSAEIGNVIKVINSIAEQTNLLALNATIEAARAGEAGKGFAVVANEVKELAQETARATEDISRRVVAIQADTQGAVAAINEIGAIIEQINAYQLAISTSVEEQSRTSEEVTRNVTEAALGSATIAEDVAQITVAAADSATASAHSREVAASLAGLAEELQQMVHQFRV
jgi:methyl-accepting chemotaxis protein